MTAMDFSTTSWNFSIDAVERVRGECSEGVPRFRGYFAEDAYGKGR